MQQNTAAQIKLVKMTTNIPPIKVRPDVLAVPSYRQGKAPARLGYKLSSNENPFEPLPVVLEAIRARTDFNRYTAADVTLLRETIAATENQRLQQNLTESDTRTLEADSVHVLGTGSVAILYQLIGATCAIGSNYVYAWPSFEAYPLLGTVPGATPKPVPLDAAGRHNLQAMAEAIDNKTGAVLLCSPNNPTGPAITAAEFHEFMSKVPTDTLVVLDEAYAEFVTDPHAIDGTTALNKYQNLVVLRTFAKAQGLAGLRLGYGFAAPELWQAVAPAAIPMSINALSEAAALAALTPSGQQQMRSRVATLIARRTELITGFTALGLNVPDTQGNFVWIAEKELQKTAVCGNPTAVDYAAKLAEQGILVRPFIGHGVRISVAEAESINAVLQATAAYLKQETK